MPTSREGGIWAPGGVVVGPAGNLLLAVGNGESTSAYDGSDSVTKLSPALRRLDFFAPTQWAQDNRVDADLGSMSPALVGDRIVIAGKSSTAYLLDAGRLGGIGGQLATKEVCRAFGAAAVSGTTVYLPCTDGVREVRVGRRDLSVGWHGPDAANGPPVLGGGAVFSVSTDSGVLYALDAGDGHVLARHDVGDVPHFASPALSGPRVYVPTLAGVTALSVR